MNTVIFFCRVTYEWMSSVFELFLLFLIVVIFSLSSWDEMNVHVKLLADDVWAAEEDKTCFLSVGVDIFDWLYLKEWSISFPMVTMSTIKRKYDKLGYVRKLNKIEICENFDEWSKYYVGLSPPYGKTRKIEKSKMSINSFWWMFKVIFW